MSMRFSIVIALVSLSVSAVDAQWTLTNGPFGGQVYGTATSFSGTVLFAATGNGVYRSTDAGAHWALVGAETFGYDTYINAITTSDSIVAAGTWGGTVYISTDAGLSWLNAGKPYSPTFITSLAINGSDIFAANPFGVYRSSDRGTTWTQKNNGLGSTQINGLLADGPRLFSVSTEITSGIVQVSTDRGDSWDYSFSWVPVTKLGNSGSTLLAGTSGFGIYRSTDHGATWDTASHPLRFSGISGFARTSDAVYAGKYYEPGVFRSTDEGAHWTLTDSIPSVPDIANLIGSGSTVFAGTDRGLYSSTDGGANWQHADEGMLPAYVGSFAVNGTTLLAGGSGCFLSTDSGLNWKPFERGLLDGYINALAILDTVFYAGTTSGVYRSSRHAISWIPSSFGLPQYAYVSVISFLGKDIFIGTAPGGVYRSTDGGASWITSSKGLTESYVNSLLADGANLWSGTEHGVFRSTDQGSTWNPANQGWNATFTGQLAISGSRIFAWTWDGIYASDRGQVTWVPVVAPFSTGSIGPLAATPAHLFAGTSDGFYAATAAGTHWLKSVDGLPSRYIASIAVTDSNVLVGLGEGGVYYQPMSNIVTSADNNGLPPEAFRLEQNYPNPFNPTTVISCQLPVASNVKLAVYDLLGREVAVLVDGRMEAGVHEVTFNASGLASGIYLCRLRAGSFMEARKLVLLR